MKKLLLLTVFLFSLSQLSAQSWVYHPFPTDSAKWRENNGDITCNCCNDYELTITGDTLIGLMSYHKLKHAGVNHSMPNTSVVSGSYWGCWGGINSWNYLSHYNVGIYNGAFREDTLAKKIYYLEPGKITDTLLYDFNLAIGDTLPETFNNHTDSLYPWTNVVTSIDSVLVNGIYHKRFVISNIDGLSMYTNHVSLIEGIGSTYGLLYKLYDLFESRGELLCFSVRDSLVYPWGGFPCAAYNVGINESEMVVNIILMPNPSNGKFQIETEWQFNSIEITDVLGKIIYQSDVKNKYTEIDLSDKLEGIYFVRLFDERGNSVVKKIIKN